MICVGLTVYIDDFAGLYVTWTEVTLACGAEMSLARDYISFVIGGKYAIFA